MKAARQTTLRDQTALIGIGVHSGLARHADLASGRCRHRHRLHPHLHRRTARARNSRRHARGHRHRIRHRAGRCNRGRWSPPPSMCWRRCAGLGVDNAVVEIDGPEAPIMDGSAAPFVAAIDQAGIESLDQPRRYIKVLKPVRVAIGDAFGELRPYARGFRIEVEIEFDHPLIGRQSLGNRHEPGHASAARSRARAPSASCATWRSCGARATRSALRSRTRWSSATTACSIRKGLRFADEFVRHKALDAIGDLALGRRAVARRLPFGARRPQAQPCGAVRADGRPERLDLGRRRGAAAGGRGHADVAARVAPAFGPDIS